MLMQEKTLESPLDSRNIKPVNSKGNQPWILIERTDAEAESLILWPPDGNSRLTGKDTDSGKDWRQKEKRVAEGEMIGLYHQLNGHELEQTPGDREGQGSLATMGLQREWLRDWTTAMHLIGKPQGVMQYWGTRNTLGCCHLKGPRQGESLREGHFERNFELQ